MVQFSEQVVQEGHPGIALGLVEFAEAPWQALWVLPLY